LLRDPSLLLLEEKVIWQIIIIVSWIEVTFSSKIIYNNKNFVFWRILKLLFKRVKEDQLFKFRTLKFENKILYHFLYKNASLIYSTLRVYKNSLIRVLSLQRSHVKNIIFTIRSNTSCQCHNIFTLEFTLHAPSRH
jgi:hypothetical protein